MKGSTGKKDVWAILHFRRSSVCRKRLGKLPSRLVTAKLAKLYESGLRCLHDASQSQWVESTREQGTTFTVTLPLNS